MENRVIIAECAMTQMLAFNQNENYFQKCYLSFKRFEIVLKNVKEFTIKVSRLEDLIELDCGIKDGCNQLDTIDQGMNILRTQQADNIYIQKIDPNVGCKTIKDGQNKHEEFKVELEIFRILRHLLYVLKFYGLLNVDRYDFMVFDWAEHGTLKELYNKHDIPWTRKIQIVRDICVVLYPYGLQMFYTTI
ncbi:kinase-like protein [Gigaspora margarita]|uniref:Kinase-like protein n=1 Tax=Gigaspora margarita TaxID=4874 RepID=A0A8H4ALF2_GIGMA|nr:kinase-like protein [Gigaspora margarita]